jgi:hypothetical protein
MLNIAVRYILVAVIGAAVVSVRHSSLAVGTHGLQARGIDFTAARKLTLIEWGDLSGGNDADILSEQFTFSPAPLASQPCGN